MIRLLIIAAIIGFLFITIKKALQPSTRMSASDAAKVLEVSADANAETILAAHRRLIAKVHPDAGGTAELAARVNQARDTLLQQLPR
jgi:hypothetical protein